jgi:RHH-type transcriptional regulator, rel operon repressor / antitoxin RelB
MGAISVKLPDEVVKRLSELSARTGRSKAFYMIEALQEHLDDLEDLYLAEQRLADVRAGRSALHSLDDVERELGLDG